MVSEPTRTVVDVLDDPALGGGMRHVAEIVHAYFTSDMRDDDLLLDYIARVGNRTIYKRLGFLLETLGLEIPALVTEYGLGEVRRTLRRQCRAHEDGK
ncbi:MAG: hypothetical protein BWY76_02629 [bacterium ADurb.Bin429]|nr:MAG: hypothetical protein BWY76_02629 [bacterium ADurb.Bin429]